MTSAYMTTAKRKKVQYPQLIRLFIRQLLGWQLSGNPVLNISKPIVLVGNIYLRSASVFKLQTKVYISVFMFKCITFIPPYFSLQRTRQVFLLLWGVNCDIHSESLLEITVFNTS